MNTGLGTGTTTLDTISTSADGGGVDRVSHLLTASAIAAFAVSHVYRRTTGRPPRHHVRPMMTGFDEVELSSNEKVYLASDEPAWLD